MFTKEMFRLSSEETENRSEYIHLELSQPGLVVKLRRYERECFLLWVDLKPPLWVPNLSAALITASAFFFIVHPSYMFAILPLNRQQASINQFKLFLEVCILMQNRMGG